MMLLIVTGLSLLLLLSVTTWTEMAPDTYSRTETIDNIFTWRFLNVQNQLKFYCAKNVLFLNVQFKPVALHCLKGTQSCMWTHTGAHRSYKATARHVYGTVHLPLAANDFNRAQH